MNNLEATGNINLLDTFIWPLYDSMDKSETDKKQELYFGINDENNRICFNEEQYLVLSELYYVLGKGKIFTSNESYNIEKYTIDGEHKIYSAHIENQMNQLEVFNDLHTMLMQIRKFLFIIVEEFNNSTLTKDGNCELEKLRVIFFNLVFSKIAHNNSYEDEFSIYERGLMTLGKKYNAPHCQDTKLNSLVMFLSCLI